MEAIMFDQPPTTQSRIDGLTLCWAVKGGSGTTVVAAALALTSEPPVILLDLAGDQPAVLGLPEPTGPGVCDWLASDAPASHLADLAIDVAHGVRLIPRGRPDHDHRWRHATSTTDDDPVRLQRWDELIAALTAERTHLIVDVGTAQPPEVLNESAERSLLVTRACYLSLRRAVNCTMRPTGVVLVSEAGRALRANDVEAALNADIVAEISVDPAVARAVDAGLLAARLPRALRRDLEGAA